MGLITRDVSRLVEFYRRLGFVETFRTPASGVPTHVKLKTGGLTIGISSYDAAVEDHGLHPDLGGRPACILLWTNDADAAYARLVAGGAASLSPPRDFRDRLRTAWVADPDGNPVNLAQRRD